ncbi:MAG: hypothetical protein CMM93_02725 [Rickettsiales bacterium]|nr:hypothetical protein [Rickettsiales bacterium]
MNINLTIDSDAEYNALHESAIQHITVEDMIALTARLAQILAKEADLLEEMKVGEIGGLQKEKVALTNALESVKKQFAKHPELLDEIDEEQADRLREVVLLFNQICEENYRRLQAARRVNQELVGVISSIIKEESTKDVYNKKGVANQLKHDSVSLSLNESV